MDLVTNARLHGEPLALLPEALYIPPEALRVFLAQFEGPLDLLLYLIRRERLDILDISIADVTEQYMRYIEAMQAMKIELAGDYLLMAATLAEIKSKMLLPPEITEEGEVIDPRVVLAQQLKAYEALKEAAVNLADLSQVGRDVHLARAFLETSEKKVRHPDVRMSELVVSFANVVERARLHQTHDIAPERISVQECADTILKKLEGSDEFTSFTQMFEEEVSLARLSYMFVAMLELNRAQHIELMQTRMSEPIFLRRRVD